MDYDHPYRGRLTARRIFSGVCLVVGVVALIWCVGSVMMFWVASRSSADTDLRAKVVDYEKAGASTRLRVQLFQRGQPHGFSLVPIPFLGGHYSPGYELSVLTQGPDEAALEYGRQFAVFDVRTVWGLKLIVAAVAGLLLFLGGRVRAAPPSRGSLVASGH